MNLSELDVVLSRAGEQDWRLSMRVGRQVAESWPRRRVLISWSGEVLPSGSRNEVLVPCQHDVRHIRMSLQNRRIPLHETGELALERLDHASAPALGHGLGHGIREDVLLPFLQAIEDATRRGLGRGLRNLEASIHISVDGAQEDGMDRHTLACQ